MYAQESKYPLNSLWIPNLRWMTIPHLSNVLTPYKGIYWHVLRLEMLLLVRSFQLKKSVNIVTIHTPKVCWKSITHIQPLYNPSSSVLLNYFSFLGI